MIIQLHCECGCACEVNPENSSVSGDSLVVSCPDCKKEQKFLIRNRGDEEKAAHKERLGLLYDAAERGDPMAVAQVRS